MPGGLEEKLEEQEQDCGEDLAASGGRRWPWIVGLLVVFIGLPVFLAWNFILGPTIEATSYYKSLIGKTESAVIADLGQPDFRVSAQEAKEKGIDFPWRNRQYEPIPDRPIHNLVLLYEPHRTKNSTPFPIYVFIGADGRVEAIDPTGS